MAEDQDSSADKSQEPTPRRIEKAREEGDIVRSRELNTMAILIAGSAAIWMFGSYMVNAMSDIAQQTFDLDRHQVFDTAYLFQMLQTSVMGGLKLLLPVFAVLLVAALIAPIGLGGWNFSTKALAPKGSRLNPLSGLKRMFGGKSLMELFKAIAKVLVVASMALLIFYLSMDRLMAIAGLDVTAAMVQSVQILMMAILVMSAATVIIAAVDIPFQIHSYREKLKMTHQQVKDEMKDTEGRPEVKQRVRQLQYQMTQNRMMSALPNADVVVTNPTHYAVALKYDRDRQGGAPVLVAKGVDMMAMKIREVANKHEIPVVESPMLARAIYYHTQLEQEIPEGLFKAVAQVLAYVFQLQAFRRGKARRPYLPKQLPIPGDLQADSRVQNSNE